MSEILEAICPDEECVMMLPDEISSWIIKEYRVYLINKSIEAKMIGAVVNIRADIFRSLIGPDRVWKDLTLELIDEMYADVPLWYITKCWDILMSEYPDLLECEYEHVMACQEPADRTVAEARNALEEIKLLWKEHYDIDIEKCDADLSRFNVFHEDTFDRTMDVILSEINYCDTLQNISYLFDELDVTDVSDLLEITASLVYASQMK